MREQLLEQLECAICFDTFKEPKFLPSCGHTFCCGCLTQYVSSYNNYSQQRHPMYTRTTTIACPTCRRESSFQGEVKDGLNADFKAISLLQILENWDKQQQEQQRGTDLNYEERESNREGIQCCYLHPREELRLVCKTCSNEVICRECAISSHRQHDYERLDDVLAVERHRITVNISQMKQQEPALRRLMEKCDQSIQQLEQHSAKQVETINSTFNSIVTLIENRRNQLISHVNDDLASKIDTVTETKDRYENAIDMIDVACSSADEELNGVQVIHTSKDISKQMTQITQLIAQSSNNSNNNMVASMNTIQFNRVNELSAAINQIGVYAPSPPTPPPPQTSNSTGTGSFVYNINAANGNHRTSIPTPTPPTYVSNNNQRHTTAPPPTPSSSHHSHQHRPCDGPPSSSRSSTPNPQNPRNNRSGLGRFFDRFAPTSSVNHSYNSTPSPDQLREAQELLIKLQRRHNRNPANHAYYRNLYQRVQSSMHDSQQLRQLLSEASYLNL